MRVAELDAHPIDQVKETKITPEEGVLTGEQAELISHILAHPPAILTNIECSPILNYGGSDHPQAVGEYEYSVGQASPIHMRSVVVEHDILDEVTDEFGNRYHSFSVKGTYFAYPDVIKSPTAENGYIPYGLQEGIVVERVVRASREMRRLGIKTEFILGVSEPRLLPYPDTNKQTDEVEYIARTEYKRRIAHNYWSGLDDEERTIETKNEIDAAIMGTPYYAFLRATDGPYRVQDVIDRPELLDYILESNETTDDYIEQITNSVAKTLAIMHANGLTHGFPTLGNISANGQIVDLDSVQGELLGLGDEAITQDDITLDLNAGAAAMFGLSGAFGHINPSPEHSFKSEEHKLHHMESIVLNMFFSTYIEHRKAAQPDVDVTEIFMPFFEYQDESDPSSALIGSSILPSYVDANGEEKGEAILASYEKGIKATAEKQEAIVEEVITALLDDLSDHLEEALYTSPVAAQELLEKADFEAAATVLVDSEYAQNGIASLAKSIFLDHLFKIVEDPILRLGCRTLSFPEDKQPILDAITQNVLEACRSDIHTHIQSSLEAAALHKDEHLLPNMTPTFYSNKGSMTYVGTARNYESLAQVLSKPEAKITVMDFNILTSGYGNTKTAGLDENTICRQVVGYIGLDDGMECMQGTEGSKKETLHLIIDEGEVLLLEMADKANAISYIILCKNEATKQSLERTISQQEPIDHEWIFPKRLFDISTVDDWGYDPPELFIDYSTEADQE